MKTAVVYYTRFGHTAVVARVLREKLDADLHRIEETKVRGYPGMGWGAVNNHRFTIKPMNLDFSRCELVVLCTPVWAGRPACPTRTFLRDARLDGRKLAVFFSTSGGPLEKALETVRDDLKGRNVEVIDTGGVVTKESTDDQLRRAADEFGERLRARPG